ncbi:hypothetical protein MPPM_1355 [Methylorubrum populi]|uniref:Uncharacterized protein n=1 Tax=Methylorubrum populi TaxID=223967 RepID=A0A160PF28_9HYPH|nr:hypothetical protein [Methylorubrum populi]BAU89960.1 hypothetical protein MPPM_1355 [Methylorubrum populi]
MAGDGKIKMRADAWFTSQNLEAVLASFLRGEPLPERVRWRDISEVLGQA